MKTTSRKTFAAISLVVLTATKSQAQRCSGANALARYHAQVGLEHSMSPRSLRGGVDNHDEDDYYLFVPEQDLRNPSESESKLTPQHMRRLQCSCANGSAGAGLGFGIIDAQTMICQPCYDDWYDFTPPDYGDDVDETLQVPNFNIPTPAPSSDAGGQRLLLEKEHRDNIAAYDPVRQGFHVMRKDGAIMRKYGN